MTYFKKYDPRIPLADGMGRAIPFRDLGSQWGLLATEDNYLIAQLRKCESEQRGGVAEVSAEEYDDLKKKENPNFWQPWREVVAHRHLKRLFARANAASAAAGKLPSAIRNQIDQAKALTRPQGVSDLVPKGVSR